MMMVPEGEGIGGESVTYLFCIILCIVIVTTGTYYNSALDNEALQNIY